MFNPRFDASHFCRNNTNGGRDGARGYYSHAGYYYGHRDEIEESLRRQSEICDSVDCFKITHSINGGVGSGFAADLSHTLDCEHSKTA